MRAKDISRCLAETTSASTVARTRAKTVLGSVGAEAGEAECATTQIVHRASSLELEC